MQAEPQGAEKIFCQRRGSRSVIFAERMKWCGASWRILALKNGGFSTRHHIWPLY